MGRIRRVCLLVLIAVAVGLVLFTPQFLDLHWLGRIRVSQEERLSRQAIREELARLTKRVSQLNNELIHLAGLKIQVKNGTARFPNDETARTYSVETIARREKLAKLELDDARIRLRQFKEANGFK